MFTPAKRAIELHSPNTRLASPGEPLPTYPDMASAQRSGRGFEDPRRDSAPRDRETRAS